MLSERERQALSQIERQLSFDDPDLAAILRRGRITTLQHRIRHTAAVLLVMTMVVAVLAEQWILAAATAGIGIGWAILRTIRRRGRHRRRNWREM
jgi:Flp pilus assembly protein TadB